jgi:hypothetical protein
VNLAAVTVDGNRVYYYDNPASDCTNCARDATITLPITTPGQHTISASGVDFINRPGTETFTISVRNDTSWTYGGSDHIVNTPDDAATVGSLLAGAGYQAIWAGLSTDDKNYMLTVADDPYFDTWAPRIDIVAPSAPDGIQVSDEDNAARTADIVWSEGSDPDVSDGVFGSAVDESRSSYRYQRSGGNWTSWSPSYREAVCVGRALAHTSDQPSDSIRSLNAPRRSSRPSARLDERILVDE